MSPATASAAPRLLLSTESLLGVARYPRERLLATGQRWGDPAALANLLMSARGSGVDGVLASPSTEMRSALDGARDGLPVYALLPNVPAYVRDSSEAGLIGAALKRVQGAPPGVLVRLGMTGMTHALGVLASDFASLLPLLLELEAAALGPRPLAGVLVAAPITDLALAGGNARFFVHLVAFIRGRWGAQAGFETHNLGHLLRRLREWGVKPDLVVGPVNPQGFLMKPSPGDALAELFAAEFPVLAKQVRAGGAIALADGARFAMERGAAGIAVDLADLEDAGSELATLRGIVGR
jgi:hypothetical protein